ncbi:hypothetical protein XENTR_v10011894 [Xenopus tropicalis]|nr:hypothetical protein XENTR_v10011894 [Xenopus tropicalis]
MRIFIPSRLREREGETRHKASCASIPFALRKSMCPAASPTALKNEQSQAQAAAQYSTQHKGSVTCYTCHTLQMSI